MGHRLIVVAICESENEVIGGGHRWGNRCGEEGRGRELSKRMSRRKMYGIRSKE